MRNRSDTRIEHVCRVGGNEVVVRCVVMEVANKSPLQHRVQMHFRFFDTDQITVQDSGGCGHDDNLMDASPEMCQGKYFPMAFDEDLIMGVRDMQPGRRVLQQRLQEAVNLLKLPKLMRIAA